LYSSQNNRHSLNPDYKTHELHTTIQYETSSVYQALSTEHLLKFKECTCIMIFPGDVFPVS